ncbi:FAD-dependent oxidoreductase [Amycolatopsis sp. NPDC005232]|uniref:FAD-dependent oxidoreductase n=1 Tax=Amycolatopsis sp. NPDC005232 TaxID=3157027 RepID=UPI0033A79A1A
MVIGGGYGGATTARALDDIADVVLVEPREAFHHTIGALRALVDPDWMPSIFLSYEQLLERGRVVRDRAIEVGPRRVVLASGTVLTPDFLVLATGSTYPFPAKSDHDKIGKAQDRYRRAHQELDRADRVLLLGAGPVGIELAGEISARWPEKKVTIVDPVDDVLAGRFRQDLRDELRRLALEAGVELVLGHGLSAPPPGAPGVHAPFSVSTAGGAVIEADIWYQCYGVTRQTGYVTGALAEAKTSSGAIRVTDQMRVVGQETVFAVGDIAEIGENRAYLASVQAEVAAANIRRQITGDGQVSAFTEPPDFIVVPFGPDQGSGQLAGNEDLAESGFVIDVKGKELMIGYAQELLGLDTGG